jgi:Ca2+-binding RTX toxin-like protein
MARYTGTAIANHFIGTAVADTMLGMGGSDILEGRGGNDTINGGTGNDRIVGGRGADTLAGGSGFDTFVFAAGDGRDVITDLASGDRVSISGYATAQSLTQIGADVVVSLSSTDRITFSNATLATVRAALQFPSGSTGGGVTGSTITGTSGWDTLNGTAGNDVIKGLAGYDVINGGAGNDRIYGGLDGDKLFGGAGADTFVYTSLGDAPPYGLMYNESDTIADWQTIDKIDLSAVDANPALAGQQHFHFAGYFDLTQLPADHSAGALYIGKDANYLSIFAYTGNDQYPDLFIDLQGGQTATAANLIL